MFIFTYCLLFTVEESKNSFEKELLTIPSTSQGDSRTSAMLLPTESFNEADIEEDESFSTQQLFQFAWQIAKGMVFISIFWIT